MPVDAHPEPARLFVGRVRRGNELKVEQLVIFGWLVECDLQETLTLQLAGPALAALPLRFGTLGVLKSKLSLELEALVSWS